MRLPKRRKRQPLCMNKIFTLVLGMSLSGSVAFSQQFCLESYTDYQVHFRSLFGGESFLDEYGNVMIDGETGGRGGWPRFRLSDVVVTLEYLPDGDMIYGEPEHGMANLVYTCKKGACIQTPNAGQKDKTGYTRMSAARAERAYAFMKFLQENPDAGQ